MKLNHNDFPIVSIICSVACSVKATYDALQRSPEADGIVWQKLQATAALPDNSIGRAVAAEEMTETDYARQGRAVVESDPLLKKGRLDGMTFRLVSRSRLPAPRRWLMG